MIDESLSGKIPKVKGTMIIGAVLVPMIIERHYLDIDLELPAFLISSLFSRIFDKTDDSTSMTSKKR